MSRIKIDSIEYDKINIENPEIDIKNKSIEVSINISYNTDINKNQVKSTADISFNLTDCLLANFTFTFIFTVDQLSESIIKNGSKSIISSNLLNMLNDIVISTSRGIIFEKMKGTSLEKLKIPVIEESYINHV